MAEAQAHVDRLAADREREAADTLEGMDKLAKLLGVSLHPPIIRDGVVRRSVRVPSVDVGGYLELRADVGRGRPEVHAWCRNATHQPWRDFGRVETLADLGLILLGETRPVTDERAQATEGDLLLQVLTALVRDVVADALDERRGGGKA